MIDFFLIKIGYWTQKIVIDQSTFGEASKIYKQVKYAKRTNHFFAENQHCLQNLENR